ncbi:class I SAM-dependent methyltransferase [Nocardia seriolae]|uniref:class I SAM-dependent methyltransferase n=1 Tax=Nocardia seriolae TaxID=37332 RepID=UPI0022A67C1C|nr:class I SAM-dependent methyltransferase [Nocardia seriolae]WKY56372.1 class I SAM-dependent methyltransferase [Nocardia seriolae]WNJ62929.1 class I SAM-dependent methyltransferase [Nocardia seriolae]
MARGHLGWKSGGVGIYEDRVLPRLVDMCCGTKYLNAERKRVCAGLHGRVLEIGFGSGRNVPFYPDTVTSVSVVEPADLGWRMAAERVAASAIPVQRSGLDGQHLPFADNSFDSALSTWTLCTIPDVESALAEVRRVLVPGGTFHFVEHGLAPDPSVVKWQNRLNPIQKAVAGGCHLNRDIRGLVESAGFEIRDIDRYYQQDGPKPWSALSLGTAVAA